MIDAESILEVLRINLGWIRAHFVGNFVGFGVRDVTDIFYSDGEFDLIVSILGHNDFCRDTFHL